MRNWEWTLPLFWGYSFHVGCFVALVTWGLGPRLDFNCGFYASFAIGPFEAYVQVEK